MTDGGRRWQLGAAAGAALLAWRDILARRVVERELDAHPYLVARYGADVRDKSLQDAGYHLAYLAEALKAGSDQLFVDYLGWAKVVLARRGVLGEDLAFHLQCLCDVVGDHLAPAHATEVVRLVGHGLQLLPELPDEVPTFIEPEQPLAPLAHQYIEALLRGDRGAASRLVLAAADDGVPVKDLYLHVFQRAQREVGRLWQTNRISVAREHFCTAATQLIMSQLYPRIFAGERNGATLVATSVAGDLHEIGIRMVADFFEMAGWHTVYLGADTPTRSVVETVAEHAADALALSVTIATHLPAATALIETLRAEPGVARTRVLVGGYPFNREPGLWRRVGADGHARDAEEAVALAERLVLAPRAGDG